MDGFPLNRGWVYDRCYSGRGALKESFVKGVEEFISIARQHKYYIPDGGIRCPCLKCDCIRILKDEIVKVHLYKVGFKPNYWIWTDHGEEMPHVEDNCMGASSNGANVTRGKQFMSIPSYNSKCAQASKNRASEKGGTLHIGGSISKHEHAMRMANKPGRSLNIDEVFQQTHIRKGNGQFVNERSKRTHEDFQTKLSQARSEVASSSDESETSPLDPALDAGGKQKGRLYRAKELARDYQVRDNNLTHKRKASSSSSHYSDEINQLKQRLSASEEVIRRMREDNELLSRQFQSFVGVVLQFLPPDAQNIVQQHQQQNDHHEQQNDY